MDDGSCCTGVMIRTAITCGELVDLVKEKLALSCESKDVELLYQVPSWLTEDLLGNPSTTIETDGELRGYFILCREIKQVNMCVYQRETVGYRCGIPYQRS